ncbi:MAG TPA: DUF4337 family protein [Clostridia bacterium]|nr:DUF4337 family protein [Clostridia bacterium]
MKVEIPEALKADVPLSTWGKVLTSTPVIMTVLATLLAGLASSEMTKAQYERALAAQQQSKAGDQWNFFQAKRLRGAIYRNTLDLLQSSGELRGVDGAAFVQIAGQGATGEALRAALNSDAGLRALECLQKGQAPELPPAFDIPPELEAGIRAIEDTAPEGEIRGMLSGVSDATVVSTLKAARERANRYDKTTGPLNGVIDQMDKALVSVNQAGTGGREVKELTRDFTAARLRYSASRYEAEARLNQAVAGFFEVQVRKSNHSAERHHARSQRFFFGMLAAQMAVIVATLAIAARQRNLLWSIAAAAGVLALALGFYVYLFV